MNKKEYDRLRFTKKQMKILSALKVLRDEATKAQRLALRLGDKDLEVCLAETVLRAERRIGEIITEVRTESGLRKGRREGLT